MAAVITVIKRKVALLYLQLFRVISPKETKSSGYSSGTNSHLFDHRCFPMIFTPSEMKSLKS